jgi:hypothetical protein
MTSRTLLCDIHFALFRSMEQYQRLPCDWRFVSPLTFPRFACTVPESVPAQQEIT